jgi:5-methyltetrahydrofolate--homocysteine methyltransferase
MTTSLTSLTNLLKQRILVLDGAMGTMIQRHKPDEADFRGERFKAHPCDLKGNNDLLNLSRPDIIAGIHAAYLEAGADIIETNTFNANRISQTEYQLRDVVHELNLAGARLAREAADRFSTPNHPRFVAGSVGPTGKSASLSPNVSNPAARNVTFEELRQAYREQIEALLEGGVDILLIETIFDTLNAKAALYAIEELNEERGTQIPTMISATITDASGRILSGQTLEAFLISVAHFRPISLGLNCALGAREMRPYLELLARKTPYFVSVHPNAGLPNQFGEYDDSPEQMGQTVREFMEQGWVNIIGGCCGTTPDHIRTFARMAAQSQPRVPGAQKPVLEVSGLEPLTIGAESNFINIGERCNVAGSRKFARLIREEKFEEALSVARAQAENGAQVIDVNMDDAMLDARQSMVTFLNLMASDPDVARLPVMIDSSSWPVIEAGLQCTQGKSIVNSISLKEGEEEFIRHARIIRRFGAAVVVMAFDEQGQASTYERRIEICARAYHLLTTQAGFLPCDIIFDPNILSIGTGIEEHNPYATDFIRTVAWIKANLPQARVSGGISNLSFSFRGNDPVREAMHSVFLFHAIRAGMDMGIVNAGMLQVYDDIPSELLERVEDVVLNRRPDATERLIEVAGQVKDGPARPEQSEATWRQQPLAERIRHALVRGITEYLQEDMSEALLSYSPVLSIIEGPLMDGMNTVGDLFGAGKMFLPQVVKSARVMRQAVAILQPYLEAEKSTSGGHRPAGKILLATVKGDVHDIGKNIVGVVLGCNNYEVIDLGVMVPSDQIVSAAFSEKVDAVGLSGLITPSLEEMVRVVHELQQAGWSKPVLIGGATTSKLHTAVKIAPAGSFPVVYVKDASRNVGVVSALFSSASDAFVRQMYQEYEQLKNSHEQRKQPLISLQEARNNGLHIDFTQQPPVTPAHTGCFEWAEVPLAELRPLIHWAYFFKAWEMPGAYRDMDSSDERGTEARKLYQDALGLLDRLEAEQSLRARAILHILPAASEGDDILIYTGEDRQEVRCVLPQLRNQNAGMKENLCLSDFLAPAPSGIPDYLGGFVVTSGPEIEAFAATCKAQGDEYNALLARTLADRVAEAAAEWLHRMVRKELWGYAPDEQLTLNELFTARYQGIRPAPGYPAQPDHSEKKALFGLLHPEKFGIGLTESYMMIPAASVCGWIFAHPSSRYFGVERLGEDQAEDYARRKGMSPAEVRQLTGGRE